MRSRTFFSVLLLTVAGLTLVGTQPAGAQFPGHDGRFAYRTTNELWTISRAGANPVQVDGALPNVEYPTWTPNGQAIIFDYKPDGDYEIARVIPGHPVVQLTHNTTTDWGGQMGPTGRIVYVCERSTSEEICTMKPDGSGIKRLTDNSFEDWSPKWSPNASRIVFSSDRMGGNHDIYSMNADGSHVMRLTNRSKDEYEPDYSPGGKRIAYWSGRNLWVMHSDGTHHDKIFTASNEVRTPSWAPSGSFIAFADDNDIYTVHPDGSHLHAVTTGMSGGENISWQPK